jgi:Sodium:dicarboxylate symporter family
VSDDGAAIDRGIDLDLCLSTSARRRRDVLASAERHAECGRNQVHDHNTGFPALRQPRAAVGNRRHRGVVHEGGKHACPTFGRSLVGRVTNRTGQRAERGRGGGTRDGSMIRLRSAAVSPSARIAIGIAAGAALWLFVGECAGVLQIVADAYVKLLQMTVLPDVTVSIIGGLGALDMARARVLAARVGLVLGACGRSPFTDVGFRRTHREEAGFPSVRAGLPEQDRA